MANQRKMGPKRPVRVIFILAAFVILIGATAFIGMNISHKQEMEESEGQNTTPTTQEQRPPTP